MSTGERLKQLRKSLGITQQEFANRIGIKRNTVANYEVDRNIPVDAVIALICREFNVNEEWLRHGTGEMFRVIDDSNIYDLLREEYNMTEAEERLIRAYFSMPEEGRKLVMDCIEKAAKESSAPLDATARAEKEKQLAAAEKQAAALRVELGIAANSEPRREQGKTREEWHQYIDEIFDGEKEDGYSSNSQDFDDATKIKRRRAGK